VTPAPADRSRRRQAAGPGGDGRLVDGAARRRRSAEAHLPLYERDKRVHGLKPFQDLVDAAPAGSTLRPPPGSYAGPVVMTKPLTIEGGGQVTIDAGDKGTVFSLQTDGAVLRGCT
jgi:hypothetical protein